MAMQIAAPVDFFSRSSMTVICQARRLRMKGVCSLSASREARVGPGDEFRERTESLSEANFNSLTSLPPQA